MAASARDRDVRQAIRDALDATGQFDGVYLSGLPEDYGVDAGELRVAVVEPSGGTSEVAWGDAADAGIVEHADCELTLVARHEDPQVRDESAELLLNVARSVLNGQSLAGITLGQVAWIRSHRYLPAAGPERRVRASYSYAYVTSGFGDFNTSE